MRRLRINPVLAVLTALFGSAFLFCELTKATGGELFWERLNGHREWMKSNKYLDTLTNFTNILVDVNTVQKRRPPLEFVVRTSTVNKAGKNLMERWFCMLMRSLALFWAPAYGDKMTLILDDESKADHEFGDALRNHTFPYVKPVSVYEPVPNDTKYVMDCQSPHRDFGYRRMLHSSFFFDLYTTAPVVAWLDTDISFIAPITDEDIFKDGKIIIYGMSARMKYGWVKSWLRAAEAAVGKPPVADFMTLMFPEYFWRDTFTNFRKHAMKLFNTDSFDVAYHQFCKKGYISTVNILANYAWHHERERYHWVLDIGDPAFKGYYEKNKNLLKIGNESTGFYIHHALHNRPMLDPYCFLKMNTDGKVPAACDQFKNKTYLKRFGYSAATWCKGDQKRATCIDVLDDYYARLTPLVKDGTFPLDLTQVRKVEEIARSMNVSCPAIGI